MGVDSGTTRIHNITENSLILRLLQFFLPLLHNVPRVLGLGVFCRCIHWVWTPHFCMLIGWGCSCHLWVLKREISLIRDEDKIYLWIKGQVLRDC